MNCCKIKKVLIILFILLGNSIFIPQNLFSDSFRVKKVVFLDMEKDNTKNSDEDNSTQQEQVKVGINDAICIKLPKDLTFIQGIELNIKIPSLLARFPNTVIYSIYNNVSPVPSAKNIDFTGKETGLSIPFKSSLTPVPERTNKGAVTRVKFNSVESAS